MQALDALKQGDRRAAAVLIERQLRDGHTSARNLESVAQLAEHIGEAGLATEARRLAVVPGSIDSLLAYWAMLASHGRSAEAEAEIQRQPSELMSHPAVLHFRGTLATQLARPEEAQELFRRAMAGAPLMTPSWFTLAMIKRFQPGDPDIAAMERVERSPNVPDDARACLYYALGKAAEDCGEVERAFAHYSKGAALRRAQQPFDVRRFQEAADRTIAEFTGSNLGRLTPSGSEGARSLFVTGLPRSGTTLTEQILLGHSAVADGAELNLFGAASIPTLGGSFAGALAYQQRSNHPDPWGEIGRDYRALVEKRFRGPGLVVDKSLGQSLLTGLLLHALPEARVAWLRRSPADVALSCFRTYFSSGLPWTWSLVDIAEYMRAEDRLFDHWRKIFPQRILTVPYEGLVRAPAEWAERLQRHFGLPVEAGIDKAPRDKRIVGTASVTQVREPISAARIGLAAAFERQLKPFRDRYYN